MKATLPKTVPPAMKKNMKGKKKANKEEVDQLRTKSKNKKEEEDEEDESESPEIMEGEEPVYFFWTIGNMHIEVVLNRKSKS